MFVGRPADRPLHFRFRLPPGERNAVAISQLSLAVEYRPDSALQSNLLLVFPSQPDSSREKSIWRAARCQQKFPLMIGLKSLKSR